jgi:hypothetical protein
MTQQEILNATFSKTEKARRLFELGFTRRQVADLIMNGNVGFAYNVWKKWSEEQGQGITALPFEFSFSRTFGIELEVYGATRDRILTEMRRLGIQVEGESYNHTTRGHWKIVSDSSISGANGNELVSPVLTGIDGMEQVKKVCLALTRAGAKVNTSCGFHVHFGANDLNMEHFRALFQSYIELEGKIDEMMPSSRRNNANTYCKSLTSIATSKSAALAKIRSARTIGEMSSAFSVSRYFKLNIQSFQRHGTIEFRQHSGTTQFSKVKNWILICARLLEYAKQNGVTNDLNHFLNESLQDYIADRVADLAA